MKVEELGLLRFGNDINMVGVIYQGAEGTYLLYLPDEQQEGDPEVVQVDDWAKLLRQLDIMETEVLQRAPDGKVTKAILRKSARQVDQKVAWEVYHRDEFACRYCGRKDLPLSVDHIITWEAGGPSTYENLVACCHRCNRTRGNTPFAEWLEGDYYKKVSAMRGSGDPDHPARTFRAYMNHQLLKELDGIPLRVTRQSR